ncbi:MAG: holo-ACP synthase [Candidatus Neomarinimicrobiota bacterium]
MIKIGTDIIEVERIKESIERYGDRFLTKVFSPEEIRYCRNHAIPEQHYAGKFAAKESVQKALLSVNPTLNVWPNQIEIINDETGSPHVRLIGSLGEICRSYGIEISVSHVKEFATATAIVMI